MKIDLTTKIMARITDIEVKNIERWLAVFSCLFIIIVITGTVFLLSTGKVLVEQQSFAFLEMFSEDKEIIMDYLPEVLDTFWEEFPKAQLVLISFTIAMGGTILFEYIRKKPQLVKRQQSVYCYIVKKGGVMQGQKTNLVPFAIIGLIIVLSIMIFYPKINTQPQTEGISPHEVTLQNEFSEPVPSATATTIEEKQAQASFTFTIYSPADLSTVKNPNITVSGKTVSGADIFVNEIDTKADSQGNFSVLYTLEEGENYLVIGANDEYGNFDEREIFVSYEP